MHEVAKLLEKVDDRESISDVEEYEIIGQNIVKRKGQDQDIARSREEILGFLLQEENLLYKFATEQIDSLQALEME